MAQSDNETQVIRSANAKKYFVQSINATTTSGPTTLNAATADGQTIPRGAMWVLQGATDFRYEIRSTAKTITSTNAVKVLADQQEYVEVTEKDGTSAGTQPVLSLKCETANGAVNVFAVL